MSLDLFLYKKVLQIKNFENGWVSACQGVVIECSQNELGHWVISLRKSNKKLGHFSGGTCNLRGNSTAGDNKNDIIWEWDQVDT